MCSEVHVSVGLSTSSILTGFLPAGVTVGISSKKAVLMTTSDALPGMNFRRNSVINNRCYSSFQDMGSGVVHFSA